MKVRYGLLAIVLVLAGCGNSASVATPAVTPSPSTAVVPSASTAVATSEPIQIGFYGPLTGPNAQSGQAELNGAKLFVDQLNAAGGIDGRPLVLVTCDDKSQPEEGVKCVTRLAEQDHVVANVGTLHSPIVLATGPLLDKYGIPTVAVGTSPTWCEKGFKNLWRATANANANTKALADKLGSSNLKTIGILYQNDDYGISGRDALKANLGLDVVASEAYAVGDKDWSGQIIKILAAKPDIVSVWGLSDDFGAQINQLRQQGWSGPILGTEDSSLPTIAETAGSNVNNTIFASLYYLPVKAEDYPDPLIRDFLVKYQAAYGELPFSDNAYRGYDAASVLANAMKTAGSTDGTKVRDAINGISDFVGLAGTFDYKAGGCEGIANSRVWMYQDGKIVPFTGL